jgi:hypothetical protein
VNRVRESRYAPFVIGGFTGVLLGSIAYWWASVQNINAPLIGLAVGLVSAPLFTLLLRSRS